LSNYDNLLHRAVDVVVPDIVTGRSSVIIAGVVSHKSSNIYWTLTLL